MASMREEKAAFKRLCKVDLGPAHKIRSLQKEYRTYGGPEVIYGAYINGFGATDWYGWSYSENVNKAVSECIKNSRKEVELTQEKKKVN